MRKIRKLGREREVAVRLVPHRGKGSHAMLYFGSARTVIQDLKKDLPRGTFHAMLDQLGLSALDLD